MMRATPYTAPPVPQAEGHWMRRALVAILVEHRLPYQAALKLDQCCTRLALRHKTMRAAGLKVRVRRLTVDEKFVQNIIINRDYTPPGFEIGPSDVVIDIGANIGTFSLAAGRAAPRGRVFAFEPNAENYTLLLANLKLNNMHNVVPTHAAVAGTTGSVRLYNNAQGGFHSVLTDRAQDLERYELVQALSLKEIFDAHAVERCDFLKLDCEGAEYDILSNLPVDYFSRIRKIAMEYHGDADRSARQAKADRLVERLEGLGFAILEYTEFIGFRGGFIRAARLE
jgi:FkbM family methyltransferase